MPEKYLLPIFHSDFQGFHLRHGREEEIAKSQPYERKSGLKTYAERHIPVV